MIVRYLNNEAPEQIILSHSTLKSGINLRTGCEALHLLQLAVCGPHFALSPSSKINAANRELLWDLLDETCQVSAMIALASCLYLSTC